MPTPWRAWRRVPRRSRRRDAVCGGAVPAAAAAGRLCGRRANGVACAAVLEAALKRDPRHPGACHLYIHMTELTPEPDGQRRAPRIWEMPFPGASHINHMPAHVWTRIGRWGDAVQASLRAWQSDQNAAQGQRVHDLPGARSAHAGVRRVDGRPARRGGAGRAGVRAPHQRPHVAVAGAGAIRPVRRGRQLGERPANDISAGVWDFARGYAALRRGDRTAAAAALERLQQTARSSKAAFRIHPAKTLLGTVAAILEGEIQRAGNGAAGARAIEAFERAVSLQDSLLVDDPEPLPLAARHWLGAALLDQRRVRGCGACLPGGSWRAIPTTAGR